MFFIRLHIKFIQYYSLFSYELSSHRKSSFLLLVIISFHHIVNLPSGFDLKLQGRSSNLALSFL